MNESRAADQVSDKIENDINYHNPTISKWTVIH